METGIWKNDTHIAKGLSQIYSFIWYPSLSEKFLTPNLQFVIMLILGIIQVLFLASLAIIVYTSKDLWYKTILKKIFFNKQYSWFIFLTAEMIIALNIKVLKCSSSGFIVQWARNGSVIKPMICETSSAGLMSNLLYLLMGGIFSLVTLFNATIILSCSQNLRLDNTLKNMRRNLNPELCMVWMFYFYKFVEDVKPYSFVQLIVPSIGYLAIIYQTLFSGSFISEN